MPTETLSINGAYAAECVMERRRPGGVPRPWRCMYVLRLYLQSGGALVFAAIPTSSYSTGVRRDVGESILP
jgi:hypothetical protein